MTHICIGVKASDWFSEDIYPLSVLTKLMGGGNSFSVGGPGKGMHSRLYTRVLCSGKFNVESCEAMIYNYDDSGIFAIRACCDGKYAPNLITTIANELKMMKSETNVSGTALKRAKNALKSTLLTAIESNAIKSEDIAKQILTYGKYKNIDWYLKKIDAVKAKDVARVVQKMLTEKPSIVIRGNTTDVPKYEEIDKILKENIL